MTVKDFVEYWTAQGFTVTVRTVCKKLTWCFTGNFLQGRPYTFFIPASSILDVAQAIEDAEIVRHTRNTLRVFQWYGFNCKVVAHNDYVEFSTSVFGRHTPLGKYYFNTLRPA